MKRPKMTNLNVEETSGVDHPAHLHPGWVVMKSTTQADVTAVVDALLNPTEDVMPEDMSAETPEVTIESLQDELAKAREELDALRKATETVTEPSEDDLVKSAPEPVQKMLADLQAEKDAALAKAAEVEATLTAEREAAADAEAIEKARAWSNLAIDAEKVGPALRHLAEVDADLAKSITEVLDAANAQNESAAIFEELGKSAGVPESGDAMSKMTALAKAAVEAGDAPTFEQAFANVAVSNPDLYAAHLSEKGA